MRFNYYSLRSFILIVLLFLLEITLSACGGSNAYETNFDAAHDWATGSNPDIDGVVSNGVLELYAKADEGVFWSVGGKDGLGDGVYEVEATQTEGPADNGYGLMFNVDGENDNFYLFEVSGDGFVWMGWCEDGCSGVTETIVSDNWVESEAVATGLNSLNRLRVEVNAGNLVFSVNGQEVGRVFDDRGAPGDIGLLVETLGKGGVRINFDNFKYTPAEEN